MIYLYKILTNISPSIQQQTQPEEFNFFVRFSDAFNQGRPDSLTVLIGIIILITLIGGLYGLIWVWNEFRPSKSGKNKITIMEAMEQNLSLSDDQNRYLSALIEKFKNKNPHDPEVGTEYLREFLQFIVQNLSHGPQTLRRKKFQIPNLKQGEVLEIMYQEDNLYRTIKSIIDDQDVEYVTVKIPPGEPDIKLEQGETASVSYPRRSLNLRGEAEIRQVFDEKLIIRLIKGLHFEEKRIYDRVDTDNIPCQLILQKMDGPTIKLQGVLQDLSLGGALIQTEKTEHEIKNKMRGHVEFELPGYQPINIKLVVVHSEIPDTEKNGKSVKKNIGIKFSDMRMKEREILHEFVTDKVDQES